MTETSYVDSKGRVWDLSLNLLAARRIDNSDFTFLYPEKFSFLTPDKNLFSQILTNTPLMFAIIWAIVQPQARTYFKQGKFLFGKYLDEHPDGGAWTPSLLSKEVDAAFASVDALGTSEAELEFCDGIDGKTIEVGKTAFWRSLTDFFREKRIVLELLETQYNRLKIRTDEALRSKEGQMNEALDSALVKEMEKMDKNLLEIHEGMPGA